MKNIPSLLSLEPEVPADFEASQRALHFAFLSGDSGGAIEQLLGEAPVVESNWMPECFSDDLFLDDFIDNCLSATSDGKKVLFSRSFLKRVLCHPPLSKKTTIFRQDIQQELFESDALRLEFETTHHKLVQLRDDLDRVNDMGRTYFRRWRLGILERISDVVDTLGSSFLEATSGMSRIRAYAQEFKQSEVYGNLAEFLRYEDGMALVNVELRLGHDGRVRSFGISRLNENEKNRFHMGPVRRFFSRVGMLLRGYQFTGEALVEQWIDGIFESLVPYLAHMMQLIGDMEFHLASLRFRDFCASRKLELCHPVFLDEHATTGRRISDLFNPLLLEQDASLVTCDLSFNQIDAMVILTGPNSGGKTRLLQSIGLLQLLGQVGFFVPAQNAAIRWANGLFVSLQAGATADQQEGRLGTELVRIRRVFEKSQPGSLVILDELCSGTNPCEGEEIFYLVISLLTKLEPETLITTHFLRFAKNLATSSSSLELEFLQVELDAQQRPTYRFVPGVAQTSLAKHTAARLGVTKQQLLDLIGAENSDVDPEAVIDNAIAKRQICADS